MKICFFSALRINLKFRDNVSTIKTYSFYMCVCLGVGEGRGLRGEARLSSSQFLPADVGDKRHKSAHTTFSFVQYGLLYSPTIDFRDTGKYDVLKGLVKYSNNKMILRKTNFYYLFP